MEFVEKHEGEKNKTEEREGGEKQTNKGNMDPKRWTNQTQMKIFECLFAHCSLSPPVGQCRGMHD